MTTVSLEPERVALERRADMLRVRLAGTLSALDRRRRELQHPMHALGKALRARPWRWFWVGAGVVFVVAGAVGVGLARAHYRTKHRAHERVRAVRRLWNHPERIGRDEGAPFFTRLLRGIFLSLVTSVVTEAVRIGARRAALPEPSHA